MEGCSYTLLLLLERNLCVNGFCGLKTLQSMPEMLSLATHLFTEVYSTAMWMWYKLSYKNSIRDFWNIFFSNFRPNFSWIVGQTHSSMTMSIWHRLTCMLRTEIVLIIYHNMEIYAKSIFGEQTTISSRSANQNFFQVIFLYNCFCTVLGWDTKSTEHSLK